MYKRQDKYDVEPGGLLYTCGALMTSKEGAAQLLGLDVSENGDTVTLVKGDTRVTLTKNSLAATVNSEMYRLDAMPMQVGSSLAIPFISVAKYFGYPTNYYNKTSGYLYLL